MPLSFAPGEAYQFDWSHETITLQGLPLTIKAAHMKLSHSRMPFVRAYRGHDWTRKGVGIGSDLTVFPAHAGMNR